MAESQAINLGVYYGRFSDDLPDQSFETVLEVNHRLQVALWRYVTPDFQYVFRPNRSDDEPDAAVVGAEIGLDFQTAPEASRRTTSRASSSRGARRERDSSRQSS